MSLMLLYKQDIYKVFVCEVFFNHFPGQRAEQLVAMAERGKVKGRSAKETFKISFNHQFG